MLTSISAIPDPVPLLVAAQCVVDVVLGQQPALHRPVLNDSAHWIIGSPIAAKLKIGLDDLHHFDALWPVHHSPSSSRSHTTLTLSTSRAACCLALSW